ncbi:MAG: hypothetical protein L7S49_07225, partial [Candidatus Poseidoniaceae archaeon]|nr:hypothetical protein [Candidatus Poseidoniaceae archaeon]
LGVKRAEIRDRLSSLTQQMDDFRSMAEVKMRESIEGKVQSEIDADETRLAEQQTEFENLKSQDSRVEKRQSWLQAISGKGTQAQSPQMSMDPSALGARPSALGANAGRQMRGAMAQAAAQHTPSMGLAGMRAPRSAAKSLSGAQPMARPVKAPIGGAILPGRVENLPQPIQHKVVRQPLVQQPVQPPVVSAPEILSPAIEPVVPAIEPVVETIVTAPKLEIAGILEQETPDLEITPAETTQLEPDIESELTPEIEPVEDTLDDTMQDALDEAMEDELDEVQATALLIPIKKLGVVTETKTATLKPVTVKVLTPVKRRGPPPASAPGMKPGEMVEKESTATLKPITKLNPVSSPNTTLNIESDDAEQ